MPPKEPQSIDLNTLDARELGQLKENLESEVQSLTQSAVSLQRVAGEFGKSGRAIERLAQAEEGQPMLVPLTGSLYVNGTVASEGKVLIDIGTGYYVEKPAEQGVEYCKRKVLYISENVQQIAQVLSDKQRALSQVSQVLERKAAKPQQ